MVVLAVGLESIWVCEMFGVWWDANSKGALNRSGLRRHGLYRSILDVSEAMVSELGDQNYIYTDQELDKALERERSDWAWKSRKVECCTLPSHARAWAR
jgi:hypothetical protein